MKSYESLIELNPEKVEDLSEYVAYCKYYFKPKSGDKIESYLFQNKINKNWYLDRRKKDKLLNEFKFLAQNINKCEQNGNGRNWCENQLAKNLKDYKSNETLKDFPLSWLKNEVIGQNKYIEFGNDDNNIEKIKQISGIYKNPQELQSYINKLPKYSFAIWLKFKLEAPYFSKDDDEFYIIQNPIIKEHNFKVPMIRGSSWKGALASAFNKDLINEKNRDKQEKIDSFLRIFGAGSESIKAIENLLLEKSKDFTNIGNSILQFMLFELGLEVNSNDVERVRIIRNRDDLINFIKDKLSEKIEKNSSLIELQTHEGRAIFYPTYFDKLSLEIINPHDRQKRAGTNPIHYEVVPKGTEGILQLIYITFDGVLEKDDAIQKEAQKDLENLLKALEKLQEKGIGAKTKLGWGRFEILDKKVCLNSDLEVPQEWERCQD